MHRLEGKSPGGTTLSISGMTCSGCANTLMRLLSRVPGVEHASVNFVGGSAVVTGTARQEDLIKAVEAAGYGVQIAKNESTGERNEHGRTGCC